MVQVFHRGDRAVEQSVVDRDNHRPAVAHKSLHA
jgi:hypothetical protein